MDEDQAPPSEGDQPHGDGTAAVLYAIFASFTEALGDLEHRLTSIESAVRAGPEELVTRLDAIEAGLRQAPSGADPTIDLEKELARLSALVQRQSELLDQRTAELAAALDAVRLLIEGHIDDTAHSLGRRAGDAGRRLASEMGLLNRPRRPPDR